MPDALRWPEVPCKGRRAEHRQCAAVTKL